MALIYLTMKFSTLEEMENKKIIREIKKTLNEKKTEMSLKEIYNNNWTLSNVSLQKLYGCIKKCPEIKYKKIKNKNYYSYYED